MAIRLEFGSLAYTASRTPTQANGSGPDQARSVNAEKTELSNGQTLTPAEQRQLEKLKQRDLEVHAHEQAHRNAAGGLAGAATYSYQRGPDGKRYAVGGEVSIDSSPEDTPEATLRKMQQVKRAALAPAEPSATDRTVAARAVQKMNEARIELEQEKNEQAKGSSEVNKTTGNSSPPPPGSLIDTQV